MVVEDVWLRRSGGKQNGSMATYGRGCMRIVMLDTIYIHIHKYIRVYVCVRGGGINNMIHKK